MMNRYTIFISYSHWDNKTGWVSSFAKHLAERIPSELTYPVDCHVWLDHRISGNDPFPEQIREAVGAADIYVAIVSYQYLNSTWCSNERDIFLSAWGSEAKGRVFLVHYRPTSRQDALWPAEFDDLLGFEFYTRDKTGLTLALGEDQDRPEHA